jgi:hypothetical protein
MTQFTLIKSEEAEMFKQVGRLDERGIIFPTWADGIGKGTTDINAMISINGDTLYATTYKSGFFGGRKYDMKSEPFKLTKDQVVSAKFEPSPRYERQQCALVLPYNKTIAFVVVGDKKHIIFNEPAINELLRVWEVKG